MADLIGSSREEDEELRNTGTAPSQGGTGSDMLSAAIGAASAFNLFRAKIDLVLIELNQQTVLSDIEDLRYRLLLVEIKLSTSYLLPEPTDPTNRPNGPY